MPPSVSTYLHDIITSCEAVSEYLQDENLETYRESRMLRAAVERELITIGEAVNQAVKAEPNLIQVLSDARRVVDFRNLAVHAYAKLQADRVWDIATQHVPKLLVEARTELKRREHS